MTTPKIAGILKLIDSHQKLIAMVHAEWCPHCTVLLPKWNDMVKEHDDFTPNVFEIEQKEFAEVQSRVGNINGFPTIISIDEEGKRIEYGGSREKDAIASWVELQLKPAMPIRKRSIRPSSRSRSHSRSRPRSRPRSRSRSRSQRRRHSGGYKYKKGSVTGRKSGKSGKSHGKKGKSGKSSGKSGSKSNRKS